jgi:hypothetical protein
LYVICNLFECPPFSSFIAWGFFAWQSWISVLEQVNLSVTGMQTKSNFVFRNIFSELGDLAHLASRKANRDWWQSLQVFGMYYTGTMFPIEQKQWTSCSHLLGLGSGRFLLLPVAFSINTEVITKHRAPAPYST